MTTSLPTLGPRGEGWVLIQGFLLVLIAAAGAAGPAWGGDARAVTTLVGLVLIAAGTVLLTRAIVDLRENLTAFPHPRGGATLVDTGAYRLVRHPIYGGIILGSVGWGLLTASPLALALAAVLFGFFDLKSRREEAWLAERFSGYAAYRARTKRFLPWVY
jgi:protein-S-isoprenylcysteine O-methyltransferase Ste14